jgi:hypothetical protein
MQTSSLSSSAAAAAAFLLCEYKTWFLTEAERERSAKENIRTDEAMGDQRHFIITHSILCTLPNENNN